MLWKITVTGRTIAITPPRFAITRRKSNGSFEGHGYRPLNAEVVLSKEKNPANPCPDTCEVTLRTKGHIIRVEEHEDDMYAAIDVAAAKVLRQLRKYKTRVIDYRMRETLKVDQVIEPTGASLDDLWPSFPPTTKSYA